MEHVQSQLTDANHRLSHLQNFRTSVARTLHLRDLPETDLLQRLQALCSAHQEFTLLSKRYETASPIGDHPCPRFDDPVPPSSHCRPPRYDSGGLAPPPATSLEPPHLSSISHHTHTHGRLRSHSHSRKHTKHCEETEISSDEHFDHHRLNRHSHHNHRVHPHRYH